MLRVFVSYSQREDQVLALRLQTLAGTRPGLYVYVPAVSTRRGSALDFQEPVVYQELKRADLVLAIIGGHVPPAIQKELKIAQQLGKTILPIVLGRHEVKGLQPSQPVFYVDPLNPTAAEHEIVQYLSEARLGKTNNEAALGLVLLAVGLLILAKK